MARLRNSLQSEMRAVVKLDLASPKEAEIAKKAMSVDQKPGSRSSLDVSSDGHVLKLDINASDLGALRATLNSSLREVKIVDSLL